MSAIKLVEPRLEKSSPEAARGGDELERAYRALGFRVPPFRITPDPSFFFPHGQYLAALSRLRFAAMSGGMSLLTAEVGMGKTLLCRYFLRQLAEAGGYRTAYVFNPKQSYAELLAALLKDLTGETFPAAAGAGALHEALYERLIAFAAEGTRVVLVLDEAHLLGPDMLENLRLLTNLETEDKKLVTLLLFGQNELEETLARRELRPLRQRIALWHRLKPFGWLETGEYIRHRLDRARDGATLGFTRAALLAARRYTGGVPRRINLICDRALLAAFARGKARVDLSLLAAAAREIGGFVA